VSVKIEVGKDVLFEALQRVFNVVPQKPTLPVLTNFLLKVDSGRLYISGTDMDMSISTSIECNCETDGAITVNAKRFISIIRELPQGTVTITVEDDRVTVEFAHGRSSMMGMSAADYPAVRDSVDGVSLAISGDDLFEMVEKTSFAVATERTRLALTGVYWRLTADTMTMVATDGHRLSLTTKAIEAGADKVSEAIVPPKALAQAARTYSSGQALQNVVFGEGVILFDFGATTIFSKLIEGPYPDYTQVIPSNNTKIATVATDNLGAVVRRVSVLSSAITHQIRLSLTPGSMEVSTTNVDIGGEARETVAIQYEGDGINAGFNAVFLAEILKKVESDDIVLELESSTSACLLKPVTKEDAGELLYLIMPLRLNE